MRTDLERVLDAIARTAARLCEANDALIFRVDGDSLRLVAKYGRVPTTRRLGDPFSLNRDTVHGRAVVDGRTIHVRDLAVAVRKEFPVLRAQQRATGIRTFLATPLRRDGAPIGVITIRRTRVRPFSARQLALLEVFAEQAALAMERARLAEELEASNHELGEALEQQTATSEVLKVISRSALDIMPMFQAVVDKAVELCGADNASILRREGDVYRYVANAGNFPGEHTFMSYWGTIPLHPGRGSLTGRVALERRSVQIDDIDTDPEYERQYAAQKVPGSKTHLGVPLLKNGEPIGLIIARRLAVRPFTDKQIKLLEIFAAQAVIAIENVRLFTELEARNRELTEALEQQTATSETLRVISRSPTDVQPVFDAIVQNALRLCDATYSGVFRLVGQQVHLVAHNHHTPEAVEALRRAWPMPLTAADSFIVRAMRECTVIHTDLQQDPAASTVLVARAKALAQRRFLVVPMIREGQPIGAIRVSRVETTPFTEQQIELLKTFADQAVIAIENVRLFRELQARTTELTRSVEQLTALGEVSRALSSTLDLETVLRTIVTRANQLAGTDACSVYEYAEAVEEFRLRATHNLDENVVAVARRTPIRKGEGAQGRMAVTRQPVQIPDIAGEDAYRGPLRDVLLGSGTRALLAIPLLREDHLVGGLTVTRKSPGEFSPEVIELLQTFAAQSALAIQNARLFREIEDKSRQLEVASRHKSQFLANMSHELRTPLNAILGYTELIADNIYGEVPERMGEVLERVGKSGRHLLGLINDILDLSKIEAGQFALAFADYSLEDVVRSVAAAAEPLAGEKKLGFEVVVDPDLPLGRGDERRLTQVLLNLVGNAIKFTEAGSVTVRAGVTGDDFRVAVADTGPGVAEGDRERIFEEFQQAETATTRAKGGTGLGLAIARRIVEMHGGRLWLESSIGRGSTFSFTVPIKVEQQVAVPQRGFAP